MRAAVFHGDGRVAPGDWPRPRVGPGELLLRVRGCGLCGSDIAKIVAPETRGPAVFGHEVVGDVGEAGDGVQGFAVGDRVVAAHHVPCGECHYCRRDSPSMCRVFKASNLDPGGFAEYVHTETPIRKGIVREDIAHDAWQVAASYRAKPHRRTMMEIYGATLHSSPSAVTDYGRSLLAACPRGSGDDAWCFGAQACAAA